MPALRTKTNFNGKSIPPNGLYIHSSPPRVLPMGQAHIKQAVRTGDIDKLEQIVLEGHGKKLVNEHSSDYRTRMYLKTIPLMLTQIGLLHDAVNGGNLNELKSILDESKEKKKKLVLAKDENGVGLLHKAIYYDLKDIYKYLIEKFPNTVSQKDMEGRTPYHYTAACKDPAYVQKLLLNAGADFSVLDLRQHSGKYYMKHANELELPSAQSSASSTRKSTTSNEGKKHKNHEGKNVTKIECFQCESSSEDSSCRKGKIDETCLGKYCYSYVYLEQLKNFLGGGLQKYWWMRGCTKNKNACKGNDIRSCTVCKDAKCNNGGLPGLPQPPPFFG